MNQTLMTAEEVAKFINVTPAYIYRLKANRKIPFIKIGGAVRFDQDQIKEWIEQHTVRN